MANQFALTGGKLYTPYEIIDPGVVICNGERIEGVYPLDEVPCPLPATKLDLAGMIICPGFIDIHLHGGLGIDFLDANQEDLDQISIFHASQGTTTLVPTLMSAPLERMESAAERIAKWQEKCDRKGWINGGIHFEGPFLNSQKVGVHKIEHILAPDRGVLARLIKASGNKARIITLAPESEGALEIIGCARAQGMIVSVGHSMAGFDEMQEASSAGVRHVCHCFNAMTSFHHRMPGILGAVLLSADLTAELILDGIHCHPAAAAILIRMLGTRRVCLITDCSPLVGLEEGLYHKGEEMRRACWKKKADSGADFEMADIADIRVYSKEGIRNGDGRLAGSSLSLAAAIRKCSELGLAGLPEGIAMATAIPARLLSFDREIGHLRPGYRADITVLDDELKPRLVFKSGEAVFSAL